MNLNKQLCVKLVHCGNINIARPEDNGQKNIFFVPMGLFPLADILKKNGVDVEIIHLDLEAGRDIHDLIDFKTVDALGFDAHWVHQSVVVLDTLHLVKKINPGIFTFLGGYTASLFAQEILRGYSQVDAVVRGDGEVPILELARILLEEKSVNKNPIGSPKLKNVRNLAWREKNGCIQVNGISYVAKAEDMNKLDFAAVDLLRNWERYKLGSTLLTHFEPINSYPLFYLEVGRGCNYTCAFCGGNHVAQHKMNNRSQTVFISIDSAIAAIKKALGFGFNTFFLCLESPESQQWYLKLFEKIRKQKLEINCGYGCWGLPSSSFIDVLSQTFDQVLLEISPETSDYEIRKKNKDTRIAFSNDQLENCLDYIKTKKNINVQLYFGFYCVGDTFASIRHNIHYILELLLKYPDFVEIEYENFSTDPGSLFFYNPEKYRMDINVRSFKDYVKCLEENYIGKKDHAADITLFKPNYITDEENINIHRYVKYFDFLFSSFRKSISYILNKTKNPLSLMDILQEAETATISGNRFSSNKTKNHILEHCKRNDILDLYLFKLINHEYQKTRSCCRISKPTTQLYLDLVKEESIGEDDIYNGPFEVPMNNVLEWAEKSEETFQVDFDI